jgi:O-methyltransferase
MDIIPKPSRMDFDQVMYNIESNLPQDIIFSELENFIARIRPQLRLLHQSRVVGYSHSVVLPYATYSPWFDDQPFLLAFNEVAEHTLCDLYRCYQLWSLLSQVARVPGAVMEVGVWRGGSGCLIAKRCKLAGIPSKVYLCDTFKGIVKAGEHDPVSKDGAFSDASRSEVEALAQSLFLDNVCVLEGIFPDETGHLVEDDALRFLHIDVDVYQSAKDVMAWAWPRLSVGGVVVFADYGNMCLEGIIKLVHEEADDPAKFFTYNLSGQAILIKTPV